MQIKNLLIIVIMFLSAISSIMAEELPASEGNGVTNNNVSSVTDSSNDASLLVVLRKSDMASDKVKIGFLSAIPDFTSGQDIEMDNIRPAVELSDTNGDGVASNAEAAGNNVFVFFQVNAKSAFNVRLSLNDCLQGNGSKLGWTVSWTTEYGDESYKNGSISIKETGTNENASALIYNHNPSLGRNAISIKKLEIETFSYENKTLPNYSGEVVVSVSTE